MNKALTVDAERARHVLAGDADVLNRKHPTAHRGRLYLHDGEMIVGTVDVIGAHAAEECALLGNYCSGWAAAEGFHWVLDNARPLACPFPEKGKLGLWTLGGADLKVFQGGGA